MSLGKFHAAEDQGILQALELQRQAGIGVFSDGEYRRTEWRSVFAEAVSGMVELVPTDQTDAPLGGGQPILVIGNNVQRVRRLTAHESGFLMQHAGGPIKITLPSVSQIVSSFYRLGVSESAYPSESEFYPDLISIGGDVF